MTLLAAPATSMTVGLSSSGSCVTVPPSMTIAAGTTTNAFAFTTSAVASSTSVTLTATLGSQNLTSSLTVTPPVAAPSAPSISSVSTTATTATISWTPIATALSYNVYRGSAAGGEDATPVCSNIAAPTFTDTGLSAGTTYYYKVAAVNGVGQSARSNESVATTLPAAPTGLTATTGNGQLSLSWTAPTGATSFSVYRGATPGGESTTAIASSLTSASYMDSGLTNGTTYYYIVSATDASGEGAKSAEASAMPIPNVPTAPGSLTATSGNTQVSLSWSPSSGATSYNIYRGTASGAEAATPIATGVTSTSYTDTGLTNGMAYYYEVTAVNLGGESSRLREASATPELPAPSAPTGLNATPSDASAVLSWTASATATSYNVYRGGAMPGAEASTPVASGVTTTSFTDTGLTNGAQYFYTVAAVNGGGASGASNEASVLPDPMFNFHLSVIALVGGRSGIGRVTLITAPSAAVTISLSSSNPSVLTVPGSVTIAAGSDMNTFNFSTTSVSSSTTVTLTATLGSQALFVNLPVTPPTSVPSAPTISSITTTATTATVSWGATPSTLVYNIYRGTTAGGESPTPVGNNIVSSPFTDTGLSSGTTYFYTVTAINSGGEGAPSSEASGTTLSLPPAFLAATAGAGQVALLWTAPAGATSYNVYRGTSAGAESSTPIASGVTTTGYTDTAVTGGTAYYYTVTPVLPAPSAPTGLTATPGSARVSLNWIAAANAASYSVYRGTASGAELVTPVATSITGTSYTDTGLTNGTAYFYTVTAVDAGGEGAASNEASATPMAPIAPPSAPTNLSAVGGNQSITLNWTASAGATSYNVYYTTWWGQIDPTPAATAITTTSFVDTTVSNGTMYYYVVTAVNSGGESATSNTANATPFAHGTGTAPMALGRPGNSSVSIDVSMSWYADNMNVYRSLTPGGEGATPYMCVPVYYYMSAYDNGVTNGQLYYYQVAYIDQYGNETLRSAEFSCRPNGTPPPGPMTIGQHTSSGFVVSWAPVAGAISYGVYGAPLGLAAIVSGTSYLDPVDYEGVYVVSINTDGAGNPTSGVVQDGDSPSPPTNLTAQAQYASVKLQWQASLNATGYVVLRSLAHGGPYTIVSGPGLTATTYTDTGLTDGTTYYYVVAAIISGSDIVSGFSNEVSATPILIAPVLSGMPGDGVAYLAWSYAYPATYNLYRSTTSGSGYVALNTSPLSGLTFTDTGLTDGTSYYYVAAAVEAGVESPHSNEVVVTPTASSLTTTLTPTAYPAEILLQWSPVNQATGYYLFREAANESSFSPLNTFPLPSVATAWADDGLTNGMAYTYKVQAAFGTLLAPLSPAVSATPAGPLAFDVGPVNIYADTGLNTAISIDMLNERYFTDSLNLSIANPSVFPSDVNPWFYPQTAVAQGSILNMLFSSGDTPGSYPVVVQAVDPATSALYQKVFVITKQ